MEHDVTPYVIDALGPDLATLEPLDGAAPLAVPRSWLPAQAAEGDVVQVDATVATATTPTPGEAQHDAHSAASSATTTVTFRLDRAATDARRADLQSRRDRLPRAPAGDLEL